MKQGSQIAATKAERRWLIFAGVGLLITGYYRFPPEVREEARYVLASWLLGIMPPWMG